MGAPRPWSRMPTIPCGPHAQACDPHSRMSQGFDRCSHQGSIQRASRGSGVAFAAGIGLSCRPPASNEKEHRRFSSPRPAWALARYWQGVCCCYRPLGASLLRPAVGPASGGRDAPGSPDRLQHSPGRAREGRVRAAREVAAGVRRSTATSGRREGCLRPGTRSRRRGSSPSSSTPASSSLSPTSASTFGRCVCAVPETDVGPLVLRLFGPFPV